METLIVINIPDDLSLEDIEIYGGISSKRIDDGYVYEFNIEDLKPLPQYRMETIIYYNDNSRKVSISREYAMGFNDCIKEILGGNDERFI